MKNLSGGDNTEGEHQTHLNCPHCGWKNYAYSQPSPIEASTPPTLSWQIRWRFIDPRNNFYFYSFQCRNCNRVYNISEEIIIKRKKEQEGEEELF
jgi:DNA-directed RNA polymerase subunit M/transcription elongation factor TFIIS